MRDYMKNLIVVSDLHCGCGMGLFPPGGVRMDTGIVVHQSAFQRKLWAWWKEFWAKWVPMVTRGKPYGVVVNGDALDGVHHDSVTQVSHNLADQARIAEIILVPVRDDCDGRLWIIRGTAVHGGESGQHEETLARRLGAVPNQEGQSARYELWKHVGKALVHVLHHVGVTSSSAYEASAVNAELTAEFVEAARWGNRPPDYVVRSHRHRAIAVDLDAANGYAAGIVTPGWQGKTPFTYRVAGARITLPQFGGIAIIQGDEEHYWRRWVRSIDRPEAE